MLGIIASAVMACAGLLHGFIFYLESFAWTQPGTIRMFSIASPEEAKTTQEMAFNQGFYNLFLGIMTVAGAIFNFSGMHVAGLTLMLAGGISMTAAALVLFISSPDKRSAAIKQMSLPVIAIALLIIAEFV